MSEPFGFNDCYWLTWRRTNIALEACIQKLTSDGEDQQLSHKRKRSLLLNVRHGGLGCFLILHAFLRRSQKSE